MNADELLASRLPRDFYARSPLDVARDLIGKLFVRKLNGELLSAWIVETEAYMGSEDPASHAYHGPTKRNLSMFGRAGHLYIYRIYGIHYCANIVTGDDGAASAVLLRAAEPDRGIEQMAASRRLADRRLLLGGPGRLCQAFGITHADDGCDLTGDEIFVADSNRRPPVTCSRRVGISVATDRCWRFGEEGSLYLSRPMKPPATAVTPCRTAR